MPETKVPFETLVGLTLTKVDCLRGEDSAIFTTDAGRVFRLYHDQDCCESVGIEEVHGDVKDILGSPIVYAAESSSSEIDKPSDGTDSWTWTFYRLMTGRGSLVIRWLGKSNGYYSERVTFVEVTEDGGDSDVRP